jgi:hypothetical protein
MARNEAFQLFSGSAQECEDLKAGGVAGLVVFGRLSDVRDNELTKLLGWPGYRVYQHEIDEQAKTLRLWVRRKRGNRKLVCSGCGRKLETAYDVKEREVRDLPCMEFRTTVMVEIYRVCCPDCGLKVGKSAATAKQSPLQQAVRGCGGGGLRECRGAPGGEAIPLGGKHRAGDGSALSGAVGRCAA